MTVKIITDSTADLPGTLADELGVEVVPGYIRFGKEVYRDGIEIDNAEFYRLLTEYPIPPATYEASVKDFTRVYLENQYTPDGIVSIHISSKLSKMYESAIKGGKKAKPEWPLEVIDSGFASVGLGLAVINAAHMAHEGANHREIVQGTKQAIRRVETLGLFDTLKYAVRGGHVTRHIKELSSIHKVKRLLTFNNGELVSEGMAASYEAGIDRLFEFLTISSMARLVGIAYSTRLETAKELRQRLLSFIPEERIFLTQIGGTLGAHCGPGAVFVGKLLSV